jgi:hypothetical protein
MEMTTRRVDGTTTRRANASFPATRRRRGRRRVGRPSHGDAFDGRRRDARRPAHLRLLVVAPHPDDESLGAGGLMQQTLAAEGWVHVLFMTNGDGIPRPSRSRPGHREPSASDYRGFGELRRAEALVALEHYRVLPLSVTFLGFPDGGLAEIWRRGPHVPAYESPYTREDNPAVPARFRGERALREPGSHSSDRAHGGAFGSRLDRAPDAARQPSRSLRDIHVRARRAQVVGRGAGRRRQDARSPAHVSRAHVQGLAAAEPRPPARFPSLPSSSPPRAGTRCRSRKRRSRPSSRRSRPTARRPP